MEEKKEQICSERIITHHIWGRAGVMDLSTAGMWWGQTGPRAEQMSWPVTGAAESAQAVPQQ